MFYTYAHSKPEGKIFYIGKGQGKRAWDKTSRNPHWHNIVNKYGFNAQVLAEWETEKEALEHEVFLIACFKDMGYELANITAGGETNPMSDPRLAMKMAKTKREKGQYSGKEMAAYNASYQERMKNPEFAKKVSKDRKKAQKASIVVLHENMKDTVILVKSLKHSGKTYKQIAETVNLSVTTVWNIVKGKTYAGLS